MPIMLLDGTVVQYLYLTVRGSFVQPWMREAVDVVSGRYDKFYYEARTGQSNFQRDLHSSQRFGSKLVAIDEDLKPDVGPAESPLLRKTVKVAESAAPVTEAIQQYEALKQGPPRKRETLIGYTVRMLLLARQLDADLWAWKGRSRIVHAIFAEAGYPPRPVADLPGMVEAGPCVFPYLPRAAPDGRGRVFRFFDPEETRPSEWQPPARVFSAESSSGRPARVFVSYSHKDEEFRQQLETHLAVMKRRGLVETWSDRVIRASEDWKGEIDDALGRADVVLLLVSADFCASQYCWDVEMRRALERHESGGSRVVPIAVRACDWAGAPFAKLQGLPRGLRPVSQWEDRDAAWLDVVSEIARLITPLMVGRSASLAEWWA